MTGQSLLLPMTRPTLMFSLSDIYVSPRFALEKQTILTIINAGMK